MVEALLFSVNEAIYDFFMTVVAGRIDQGAYRVSIELQKFSYDISTNFGNYS